MSTLTHTLSDNATMVRRSLLHIKRYPSLTLTLIILPVVFLLLFVYVFGGTLGDGLGAGPGGRQGYLAYVVPGILVSTVAAACQGTAITVAMDTVEGIVARFKTMHIARTAVLTGHVVGSLVQTMLGLAVVLGLSVVLGFRPSANPVEWLAVVGVLVLVTFALTWLMVALGLVSKTVEGASNLPAPIVFLPFLGSGFVPTDSLPGWLRAFAEHQPFTPVIETVRGLLTGSAIGSSGWQTVAWSAGIALLGYVWARRLFARTR
jgi:ABC-2 type transport system permease protein